MGACPDDMRPSFPPSLAGMKALLELGGRSPGGTRRQCSGNSFATPHMTGVCALILGKHPELTPFQLKSVLHGTATNVEEAAP